MPTKTPRRREAAGRGVENSVTGLADSNRPAAQNQHRSASALDLPAFRERLVAARARLIERIILEYDPERAYPDTAWTRMVADLHVVIMAVDAMISEDQT